MILEQPIRTESGVFGPKEMAEETAVYRIYDVDDVLLYVGMSVSPETRFADHRTCKSWMEQAHRYEIAWYATRAEADREEKRAIREERPRHNSVHAARTVKAISPRTPGVYTVKEIATRFSVSTHTVRAVAKDAAFPRRIGDEPLAGRRGARYPAAAVDAYWAQRQ